MDVQPAAAAPLVATEASPSRSARLANRRLAGKNVNFKTLDNGVSLKQSFAFEPKRAPNGSTHTPPQGAKKGGGGGGKRFGTEPSENAQSPRKKGGSKAAVGAGGAPAPVLAAATSAAGMHMRKMTKEERQKQKFKRQEEVLQAIGKGSVTEKHVLERVGDSRYTREILRRLLAQGMVDRKGKGGSNDPFLYSAAVIKLNSDGIAIVVNLIDPGLEVRLKRIETKITALLINQSDYTTEKFIRTAVGDNTGTGKAIRRLVTTGRVIRAGKGGVGDPYRYRLSDTENGMATVPSSIIGMDGDDDDDCLSTSPSGASSPTHGPIKDDECVVDTLVSAPFYRSNKFKVTVRPTGVVVDENEGRMVSSEPSPKTFNDPSPKTFNEASPKTFNNEASPGLMVRGVAVMGSWFGHEDALSLGLGLQDSIAGGANGTPGSTPLLPSAPPNSTITTEGREPGSAGGSGNIGGYLGFQDVVRSKSINDGSSSLPTLPSPGGEGVAGVGYFLM